ncbi:Dynamin-like protein, mitochondrial [Portunus trituberculatus]|uniref:Dynamin-like protein, mitochondrial n=1 Tax=Portunus trituberculatus TaxID=210409 RepID=A0A5B7J1L6_PORTR|nr:Dynamin-like protein, mitochondrial [Portunus trituberculatus]
MLPRRCVEVGWETLQDEFRKFIERAKNSKDHDTIFDNLKACVVDEAMRRHAWEDKVRRRRIVFLLWYCRGKI